MVKLVFIIAGLSVGGAENMQFNLLTRIDRTKFSCHVISLTDVGEIGRRMTALGVPVEALGMRPGAPNPIHLARLILRLRQINPDVVHTWMYHADLIGGLAARFAGVPVLIWGVRSADFLRPDTNVTLKIVVSLCVRMSSRLPDYVIYNSQTGKTYHEGLGYRACDSLVVPNGVDVETFRPSVEARDEVRKELGIPLGSYLVGLIARFDSIKNQEGFIRAAWYLHQEMPAVHFVMAGPGIEWSNPKLNKLIDTARLTRVFHLLGNRDDIPRLTASLDLQSLTSGSEAFPNVLIEAMACGVPCVSTDVGDAAMILGDAGRLVPKGDMKEMARQWAALLKLPRDERRALEERARARVINQFEISAVVRRYESIYLDAMRNAVAA